MKTPPESLRRILAAQKAPAPAVAPGSLERALAAQRERTYSTVIWNDGEVWREVSPGRFRQISPTP